MNETDRKGETISGETFSSGRFLKMRISQQNSVGLQLRRESRSSSDQKVAGSNPSCVSKCPRARY